MGLAYANRFAQDDAWISFRYARNLVRGEELVPDGYISQSEIDKLRGDRRPAAFLEFDLEIPDSTFTRS